ncbi:unnamed protein product [Discosporangium mesarthrocarpum]
MRGLVATWVVSALSAGIAAQVPVVDMTNATFDAKSLGTRQAGDDITLFFEFDDGMGGTEGHFFFNLFKGESCGVGGANNSFDRVAALCPYQATGGCLTDKGEYNVTLPSNLAAGIYSINMGYFGPSPRDCTGPFNVTAAGFPVVQSTGSLSGLCDPTIPVNVRFAAVTDRVYFEHSEDGGTPGSGGCANLKMLYDTRLDLKNGVPKGPIYILDESNNIVDTPWAEPTGKWYIESDLYVLDGITLEVVNEELRIESTDTAFHNLRGHGGSLYFEKSIVTSWDMAAGGPREAYDVGRSYISCVSEMTGYGDCGGGLGFAKNDMGECRLDILETEMGYMGWMDSESYGLTWKVRGFCVDKSNPEVFANVNVYGDIMDSDIHHMYYGMYSYGHEGGVWVRNKMHDNVQYGFDPHDDSDFLTIADNDVYNNGNHGIIASKRCNDVEITNNYVHDGTGLIAAGIFLHRSSDRAIVSGNTVENMPDAGIAIMESFDLDVFDNSFTNIKYGVRISVGGSGNNIHNNVFEQISKYGLYTYEGSDAPDVKGDEAGRPKSNQFVDNEVLECNLGIKIGQGDDSYFSGNTFTEGPHAETGVVALTFQFQNARETVFLDDNTYPSDVEWKVDEASCFASESAMPDPLMRECTGDEPALPPPSPSPVDTDDEEGAEEVDDDDVADDDDIDLGDDDEDDNKDEGNNDVVDLEEEGDDAEDDVEGDDAEDDVEGDDAEDEEGDDADEEGNGDDTADDEEDDGDDQE